MIFREKMYNLIFYSKNNQRIYIYIYITLKLNKKKLQIHFNYGRYLPINHLFERHFYNIIEKLFCILTKNVFNFIDFYLKYCSAL